MVRAADSSKEMKNTRILNGYIVVYEPNHPRAMKSQNWRGYIYEHIVVAEKKLGRHLMDNEVVHHLDCDRSNNHPNNLLVLLKSQHVVIHEWISRGAPISKEVGGKGINSEKAKSNRIRCKICNKVIVARRKHENTFCSTKCYKEYLRNKSVMPNKEGLISDIQSMPSLSAIGRKYGVSHNAVKKWIKKYNLICQP